MKFLNVIIFWMISFALNASEFTICSYNCGALSDHYDYLRAACMQKLMQERYQAEPIEMALNEKMQRLALKILFSEDAEAKQKWEQKDYHYFFNFLIRPPSSGFSSNAIWHQKANEIISNYKVRPVCINDEEVRLKVEQQLSNFLSLDHLYQTLFERTVLHDLKFDIFCLQEADDVRADLFPPKFTVLFSNKPHSQNGVAWNHERFDCIEVIGDILERAFGVILKDKETDKLITVISGHISGCNPYFEDNHDADKGNAEIKAILEILKEKKGEIQIIGMDANVTALHPRLKLVKEAGFQLDDENYIEPTCTNPYYVLNTRIDWIVLKSTQGNAKIINVPVLNIFLNSIQTNVSDHKPVAAKIIY